MCRKAKNSKSQSEPKPEALTMAPAPAPVIDPKHIPHFLDGVDTAIFPEPLLDFIQGLYPGDRIMFAVGLVKLTPSQKDVASALLHHGWSSFPGVRRLSKFTCMSVKAVRNHLRALARKGVITICKRYGPAGRRDPRDRFIFSGRTLLGSGFEQVVERLTLCQPQFDLQGVLSGARFNSRRMRGNPDADTLAHEIVTSPQHWNFEPEPELDSEPKKKNRKRDNGNRNGGPNRNQGGTLSQNGTTHEEPEEGLIKDKEDQDQIQDQDQIHVQDSDLFFDPDLDPINQDSFPVHDSVSPNRDNGNGSNPDSGSSPDPEHRFAPPRSLSMHPPAPSSNNLDPGHERPIDSSAAAQNPVSGQPRRRGGPASGSVEQDKREAVLEALPAWIRPLIPYYVPEVLASMAARAKVDKYGVKFYAQAVVRMHDFYLKQDRAVRNPASLLNTIAWKFAAVARHDKGWKHRTLSVDSFSAGYIQALDEHEYKREELAMLRADYERSFAADQARERREAAHNRRKEEERALRRRGRGYVPSIGPEREEERAYA